MAAAAWSWVEKMLQVAQRTSAPSAFSVSISTAVWIVMCSEPVMRAPRSGCSAANSSRIAIRPGISVSAMRISLRPQSASDEVGDDEVVRGLFSGFEYGAHLAPSFRERSWRAPLLQPAGSRFPRAWRAHRWSALRRNAPRRRADFIRRTGLGDLAPHFRTAGQKRRRRHEAGVLGTSTYAQAALRLTPAASASAAARSVFSHVNSGSSRPKWPYAAVFS